MKRYTLDATNGVHLEFDSAEEAFAAALSFHDNARECVNDKLFGYQPILPEEVSVPTVEVNDTKHTKSEEWDEVVAKATNQAMEASRIAKKGGKK